MIALAEQIHLLVQDMPRALVMTLVRILEHHAGEPKWASLSSNVARRIHQPSVRQKVLVFLEMWQQTYPHVGVEAVVLGMVTAVQTANHYRQAQQLDLVWTGPDSHMIPLRRNDQALLQLINEAQTTLHIVSFAVYKAQNIYEAIVQAAKRGVRVSLYMETPDESRGKISFDPMKSLGKEVTERVQVYVWPQEKRPLSETGKRGSLHAKVALADGRLLLLSSANLTDYAMTLNMEMGILIRGGREPQQVEGHLLRLIEQGLFVPHE